MKIRSVIFFMLFSLSFGYAQERKSSNALPSYEQKIGNASFKMLQVPGGTFMMGDPMPIPNVKASDNGPAHSVKLNSFYLAETELTKQVLYELLDTTAIWDFLLLKLSLDGQPNFYNWLHAIPDSSIYLFSDTCTHEWPVRFNTNVLLDSSVDLSNAKYFCSPNHVAGKAFLSYFRALFFERLDEPAVIFDPYMLDYVIKKLNEKTGKKYRLPTEAEWEYAASVGGKYKYFYTESGTSFSYNHLEKYAYFYSINKHHKYSKFNKARSNTLAFTSTSRKSYTRPLPVKSLLPNDWGFYDMLGNMWEYCADGYVIDFYANSPTDNPLCPLEKSLYQVIRGGSYTDTGHFLSLYHRSFLPRRWLYYYQLPFVSFFKSTLPNIMGINIGVRLASDE